MKHKSDPVVKKWLTEGDISSLTLGNFKIHVAGNEWVLTVVDVTGKKTILAEGTTENHLSAREHGLSWLKGLLKEAQGQLAVFEEHK